MPGEQTEAQSSSGMSLGCTASRWDREKTPVSDPTPVVLGQEGLCPPPRGHLAISGNIFNCHDSGVLLASRVQRSRMLPNILQNIDQPASYYQPKMLKVLSPRNPNLSFKASELTGALKGVRHLGRTKF